MKKKYCFLVMLLVATMVFTACSSNVEPEAPKNNSEPLSAEETTFEIEPLPERQTIRVAYFSGTPHALPFYIAEQEGFFDELNIDVEYEYFINGPAMMEANSSWDIGTSGAPGVIVGQLGYDVKMIGVSDYETNLALFVREDSPIYKSGKGHVASNPDLYGKPEDWKGTTWLYPVGTNLHFVLASALEKQGLTPDDISSINMDVNSALTAFKGGQGDGVAVWNAFALEAEDSGFIRVADAGILGDKNVCGLIATEDALAKKRDLIKKVWQLYYRTWEWAKSSTENMQKAIQYYIDSCDEQGILINESIAERMLKIYNVPKLAENIQLMEKVGPDERGKYTSRDLLLAEQDLLVTMDFFISQGKYADEQRNKILDKNLVDNSIAIECYNDMLEKGIEP